MEPTNQYIPHELKQLIELGKQKKLWALEVIYSVRGEGATKLKRMTNLTLNELMNFRENMFKYGFKIELEPGHWKIICPMDILEVDLYQQDAFFFDPPATG